MNITRLQRIVLDNGTAEGAPRAAPADAAQQAEPDKAACDVEFTSILSRCGGRAGEDELLLGQPVVCDDVLSLLRDQCCQTRHLTATWRYRTP